MTSEGEETKENATLGEEDNDDQKEFVEGNSQMTSDRKLLQSVATSSDDVNSSALHTSADVPYDAETATENCVEAKTFTKTKDLITDVIDDAMESPRDETESMANQTVEKNKCEIRNVVEDDLRNDEIRDGTNAEIIDHETQAIVKETDEMDEPNNTVPDEAKAEASVDDYAEGVLSEVSLDETKDAIRNVIESEVNKEVKDHDAEDVAKEDTVRHESNADNSGKTRDETKDLETNSEIHGDTTGDIKTVTIDDESRSVISEDTPKQTEESDGKDADDDDSVISVGEDIWRYIQKTKDWMDRISLLKKQLDVEIEESSSGERMKLRVSGLTRLRVEGSKVELRNLISECQDVVVTTDVPCLDNLVHAKIVKLMKAINRLPCYVSAPPQLIRVTGTKEETFSCLEKLQTYGVHYELERNEEILEKSDIAEEEIPPETFMDRAVDNSQQESLSTDLPVPIEKHLWHFIREKRQADLREIEVGFGVKISTKLTNDVSTVAISISTLSPDNAELLFSAEQALSQLLERLGLQVVVTCVLEGEGVAQMSQEVLNVLRQDLSDVDVILEVIQVSNGQRPGHRLLVIGPEKEIALSQQTIKRAFEKLNNTVDPSMMNGRETSNVQQMFQGHGQRVGNRSMGAADSQSHHPFRHNAGPATVTAVGRPVAGGAGSEIPPETNGHSDRNPDQSITSEPCSEPTFGKVKSSGVSSALHVTKSESGEGSSADSSHETSEQSSDSSRKEEKGKKVTFRERDDGIRVYASNDPEADHESDARDRSEQRVRSNAEKTETGSRDKSEVPYSTTGHHFSLCSTCSKDISEAEPPASGCTHIFCLTCVRNYVAPAADRCPLCGNSGRPKAAVTQPIGGQMLVTYNNAARLPGLEKKSKGIITVIYVFKEGYQTDDCEFPGKPYPGLTKTAFLPLSPSGSEVLDLLQKAFEARVTFRLASTPGHHSGELVWNDILHKENIYGGPREGGFPDPVYMERVRHDLLAKGLH